MRALTAVALVVLGVLALSCGDSNPSEPSPPEDPIPGWLKVRLTTANADNGGIIAFTIRTFPSTDRPWASTARSIRKVMMPGASRAARINA